MELIDIPTHINTLKQQARELCQPWLDEYDIDDPFFHVKKGTPWKVINSLANKLRAQCVVIGSMGRTGVPGKRIGNTAEKVIHYVKSDLLVVRPD